MIGLEKLGKDSNIIHSRKERKKQQKNQVVFAFHCLVSLCSYIHPLYSCIAFIPFPQVIQLFVSLLLCLS